MEDVKAPGPGGPASGESEEERHLRIRREQYAVCGYDIQKERDFVIDVASPIGPRILETGTGKGYFTMSLARRGFKVTSIDVSDEEQAVARLQLEKAGLAGLVTLRRGDAESTGFPDASFDAVFSVNLLHHLKRADKALDEMARVLARGGKLVMSDFTAEGFRMLDGIFRREGGRHEVAPFGLADAERHLRASGFAVEVHRERFQVVLVASRPASVRRAADAGL